MAKPKPKKLKNTFSWTNPKLEVRDTGKYGMGVFTKEGIKKGERLIVFGGYAMTVREEQKLSRSLSDNAIQIDDDLVIGIRNKSEVEIASCVNHSCNPNAGFRGQIFLVAIKNIKKDEEVLFDYAMVLHDVVGVQPYKMKCECGQERCRRVVGVNDWKKIELQKKYRGYFQWYLQQKINNKINI
jgi:uncharacterized protein